MTRTRGAGGHNGNLQPTKLLSRRENVKKIDDHKNHVRRDMFHPDLIKPNSHSSNGPDSNLKKQGPIDRSVTATKIGLGPVMFNLKPQHYFNSKNSLESTISLDYYRKKYPNIAATFNPTFKCTELPLNHHSQETSLCKSMNKLSLCKTDGGKPTDKIVRGDGLLQQSFKKLVAERISYESGQSVTVQIDDKPRLFKKSSSAIRKAGVRNWKSPEGNEELYHGLLRNLFSWSLPTSTRWKEVEDRVAKWGNMTKENGQATVKQISELLNISVEEMIRLQFYKDMNKVVDVLKKHVCHSTLPWLTTVVALSELQLGNSTAATKSVSDSHGTFLHSEIIDKHICYISRNEDMPINKGQRSSFSSKGELFRKQINDTISFGNNNELATFEKHISDFEADWNIVQITALVQSKNRFGMDLYSKKQIPQLLISAMAHVPNEVHRSCFSTFCPDPPVYEGSLMRLGLMEEFQKILDRNLVISDDSIVISRKNYWDERSKHNQAMMAVIQAMEEEWIGPWNFVLSGHTRHRDIQDKIYNKIVTPSAKKYKLSNAQKLLLYKITENYKCLHPNVASALETMVSYILKTPETGLSVLCKKIRDIGSDVPLDNRHPTILVVDQELEIYPWESMSCLVNTDVTRMPSINLIRSNYNFVSSLRPSYPDIVDSNSCTFVLNPDGTLPNVQKRLEKYFLDHKQWVPVIGRPPVTNEIQDCLEKQHVFLYNGHGAGSNFYPDYAVQKLVCQAVPLLMGCASAQAHYTVPRVYGSSTIHSYFLAGCPSVVGYLWEVTDAECDRITVDLIERWLPDENIRPPKILFFDQNAKRDKEACLSTAMRISRKAATQFLTQCAIVCYGLPINTIK